MMQTPRRLVTLALVPRMRLYLDYAVIRSVQEIYSSDKQKHFSPLTALRPHNQRAPCLAQSRSVAAANNNDNNPSLPEEAFSTDSSRLSLAGADGRR